MVVFMLAAAIHTVVTAFLPTAVYAVLAPNALAIVLYMRPTSLYGPIAPLTLLACGTLFYFAMLARRIYASQLDTLVIQEEKDALIVELEQVQGQFGRGAAARGRGQPRQIALPRHHVA